MKKAISKVLALSMAVLMVGGLTGCGESDTALKDGEPATSTTGNSATGKVELVSDTVNGLTLNVPKDFSEFAEINGVMLATNDTSTASIGITAKKDAGGGVAEAYDQASYQSTQMSTYSDVKFFEFKNDVKVDGVTAVYAHATGTNPSGVQLELNNFILFFEDGTYQSIVLISSVGNETSLKTNMKSIIDSINCA